MKLLLNIAGAAVAFIGIVWILQGVDILPGSFMTGQIQWAYYGIVAVIVGGGLMFAAKRMKGRRR